MAIKLPCPRCKRSLSVPNKKAGGYVQCPQCSGRLWVPKDAPADAQHLDDVVAHGGSPPPVPPADAPAAAASPAAARTTVPLPPPASSDTLAKVLTPAGPPMAAPPSPSPAPPSRPASQHVAAGARNVPQPPFTPGPVPVPQRPVSAVAPNTPVAPVAAQTPWQPKSGVPASSGAPPAAPPIAATPVRPPAAQPQPSGHKVARFISAEAAQSTLKLAADGKLPELHLEEGEKKGKDEKKERSVNPLVLVIGLGASVVMSILLAIGDFGSQSDSQANKKWNAREIIRTEYYRDLDRASAIKPYQQMLRDADLAHARKDFREERQLYRQVLDLLHAEGRAPGEGLTGSPMRDAKLEQQISILLSD